MTEQNRLEVGDTAPAFSLQDDAGNTVSLSDYAGKRVVVYFYPRANTPGCTTEACDFRDAMEQLNDSDVAVIGISPDEPDALAKFREDHDLNFPLLSDPEKETLTAYGAFGEKNNYGKKVHGVIRSTFVVEPDGKIGAAKYNVKATGHVARLIKELYQEESAFPPMTDKNPVLLAPRRRPAQARSRVRFERILKAARDVLVDLGFESFTFDEVSK